MQRILWQSKGILVLKNLTLLCFFVQNLQSCIKSSRNNDNHSDQTQNDLIDKSRKKVDASKLLITKAIANSLALGSHRSLDLSVNASQIADYVSYRISMLETGKLVTSGRIYFGSEVFSNLEAGKINIELSACVEEGHELKALVYCGKKVNLLYVQDQNLDPVVAKLLDQREGISQEQKIIGSELSNLGALFLSQTDLARVQKEDYEIVALSAVVATSSPSLVAEVLEKSDEVVPKVKSIEENLSNKHQQLKLTSEMESREDGDDGQGEANQNKGVNLAEGAAMLYVVGALLRTFDSQKSFEAKKVRREYLEKMMAALDQTIKAKHIQIEDLETITKKTKEKLEIQKSQSIRHNGYIDTLNENIRDFEILKAGFASENRALGQEKSNYFIEKSKLKPGQWDLYTRYGKRLGLLLSVGLLLFTDFDERVAGQIDRNISLLSFWLSEDPQEKRKNSFLISVGYLFKKLVELKNKSKSLDEAICLKIACRP